MSGPCLLLLSLCLYIIHKMLQPVPCAGTGSVLSKEHTNPGQIFQCLKKIKHNNEIFHHLTTGVRALSFSIRLYAQTRQTSLGHPLHAFDGAFDQKCLTSKQAESLNTRYKIFLYYVMRVLLIVNLLVGCQQRIFEYKCGAELAETLYVVLSNQTYLGFMRCQLCQELLLQCMALFQIGSQSNELFFSARLFQGREYPGSRFEGSIAVLQCT